MIRYRRCPFGGRAIVEADPADIHAFTPHVIFRIRRSGISLEDAQDIAQEIEFIAWRAVQDGIVREFDGRSAEVSLRAFIYETAWRKAANFRRLFRHRHELHVQQADTLTSPDARIEARDILDKLCAYPAVLALLVGYAESAPKIRGMSRGSAYSAAKHVRAWLREVVQTGEWREPPQPLPPTPRHRKGKR